MNLPTWTDINFQTAVDLKAKHVELAVTIDLWDKSEAERQREFQKRMQKEYGKLGQEYYGGN